MALDFLQCSALEPKARERLSRYAADLLRFNRALNLVSRRDPDYQIGLLLQECVSVALWLRTRGLATGPWVDLGSGAGFPGLVLGIVEPEQELLLVERRRGRCDFLRREIEALELGSIGVEEADARRLGAREDSARFALVCLKAVAPPEEALELARPFLAATGRVLLFQRPGWGPERGSGERRWSVEARWRGEGPLEDQAAFLVAPGGA